MDSRELKIIGQRCKELREKLNPDKKMSQRDLAEKIGISYSRISRIESGKDEMTMKELQAYKEAFPKCSYDYLLGGAQYRSPKTEEVCKITGLTGKALKRLTDIKYNMTILYSKDGKDYVIQTNENGMREQIINDGGTVQMVATSDNNMKTINALLENQSGIKFIEHLSKYLFSEYVNSDTGETYFRVKQNGQEAIEFFMSDEIAGAYLLKAQSDLTLLKDELKGGVDNG